MTECRAVFQGDDALASLLKKAGSSLGVAEVRTLVEGVNSGAVPADDAAPPAFDVPADARDQLVVLAVPQSRPGVPDSDAEAGEGGRERSAPPRFRVADVDIADVQIGRAHV